MINHKRVRHPKRSIFSLITFMLFLSPLIQYIWASSGPHWELRCVMGGLMGEAARGCSERQLELRLHLAQCEA